jgi:muramoyltetrapeptide carboxypeptidase
MITPPALKIGDTIALICTARKIEKSELQFAIELFNNWGLKVAMGKSIYLSEHQFAGNDEARANDLQNMLNDENIKAIIVARGGYGTVRIIDKIDFEKFKQHPKWIVGYSDITVLHSHIHKHCEVETLHAPMPIGFEKNTKTSLNNLRKLLFQETMQYNFKTVLPNKPGTVEGCIIGGNLSVLCSINGSISDIDTNGKILFLEDLDEYLYHIDRMMMQLKRSGKLNNLKALLVGGFTEMKDNTVPFGKSAYEIIAEHVSEYNYPVAFNIHAGHINDNNPLVFGRNIKVNITKTNCDIFF